VDILLSPPVLYYYSVRVCACVCVCVCVTKYGCVVYCYTTISHQFVVSLTGQSISTNVFPYWISDTV